MMQMGANCWERVRSRFVLVVNFKEGPSGGGGGGRMVQIIIIKRMKIFPDQLQESSSEIFLAQFVHIFLPLPSHLSLRLVSIPPLSRFLENIPLPHPLSRGWE